MRTEESWLEQSTENGERTRKARKVWRGVVEGVHL